MSEYLVLEKWRWDQIKDDLRKAIDDPKTKEEARQDYTYSLRQMTRLEDFALHTTNPKIKVKG